MRQLTVTKHGPSWRVHVNGRYHSAHATHAAALERAHRVASYARVIRWRRDIERAQEAINRMENR